MYKNKKILSQKLAGLFETWNVVEEELEGGIGGLEVLHHLGHHYAGRNVGLASLHHLHRAA